MSTEALPPIVIDPAIDVENNPLVRDVNEEHQQNLSRIEKACKAIADATGAPLALFCAIGFQLVWVAVGSYFKWDPYPFVFLLTVSNIIQLILIFVIAVAQRQSSEHAELRAEADHDHISRLIYHQEVQEAILVRLAQQANCDLGDIKQALAQLAKPA
jgi:uncharacterized membrane protein